MLALVKCRLVDATYCNELNMLRMGLPPGHIWPCSLLCGCIGGEAINTPSLLLGLSVGPSVCLPAGVSAGLQQHDVSRGSEHSLTSVTARGVLCAPDSRITAQTMQAGHKHRPECRGRCVTTCCCTAGDGLSERSADRLAGGEQGSQRSIVTGYTKMEISKWRGIISREGAINTTLSFSAA